jgi:hypothetical protein
MRIHKSLSINFFVAMMIFLLIIPISLAYVQTKVSSGDVSLETEKAIYYCEPIYNDKGECLVRARFYVETQGVNEKIELEADFKGNDVSFGSYTTDEQTVKKIDDSQKEISGKYATEKYQIEKGINEVNVEFWAKESGHFDVGISVYDSGDKLRKSIILDPIYNVSVNATYPSYYLFNGTNMNATINEYDAVMPITTQLSDNNDSTFYYTIFAGSPVDIKYIMAGYPFGVPDDFLEGKVYDWTAQNDGYIHGNVFTQNYGDYYAGYISGGSYVSVNDRDSIESFGNDLTFCVQASLNRTFLGSPRYLIDKKSVSSQGYYMYVSGINTLMCQLYGSTNTSSLGWTDNSINDTNRHIFCCRKDINGESLWVDGVQRNNASKHVGSINNTQDLLIGQYSILVSGLYWQGSIVQAGFFNTSLSNDELLRMNDTGSIGRYDMGDALSVFFNYSMNNLAQKSYYLRIKTLASRMTYMRVMAYNNMSDVNSSRYKTVSVPVGVSFISLNDIISEGYNLPIRIWGIIGRFDASISEVSLYVSENDTQVPSIYDCKVNQTVLTCGGTIRMQCNISDDGILYKAYLTANMTWIGANGLVAGEEMNKMNGIWYDDRTYSSDTNGVPLLIKWIKTNATDLGGNFNTTYLDINTTYVCDLCFENWTQINVTTGNCSANDTIQIMISYIDQSACNTTDLLPLDNGTMFFDTCNYCSENIYMANSTCNWNGTQYTYHEGYYDLNYASCCNVTGIVGDCGILYTYFNETKVCYPYVEDMNLSCDAEPIIKGKMYCLARMPDNNEYKCYSYVRQDENYLQTNPTYVDRSGWGVISWNNEVDTRDYFQSQNRLVNFFFTDKSIVAYTRYTLGLVCSDGNSTILTSEMEINPVYDNHEEIVARGIWGIGNVQMIIVLVILALFLIMIVWIARKG